MLFLQAEKSGFAPHCGQKWHELVALSLLLLAFSSSAEPRLFLPVFSDPVPAPIERQMQIVSGESGQTLGTLFSGVSVTATAMSEDGKRLFIGIHEDPGGLAVYSVRTGLLQTVDIPVVFPNALALDEHNDRLFVGSNVDNIIAEIDLVSLRVTKLIELSGPTGGVSGIAVDPNRARLHLIRNNALETIDPATSEVLQCLDVQPTSAVPDMQRFDALRDRLYFATGLTLLDVFDVTEDGLVPHATVEFDRTIHSLFLDAQGARLYAGVTSASSDEGTYAIDIDSIPPGASSADAVDTQFLPLPRRAPYMDLDRDSGILYLVQDYHVTLPLPPRPPGDPMTIFTVDPVSMEIQQTLETPIGGPLVPVDRFLTRINGPNGAASASVPALTGLGLSLLLVLMSLVGLMAARRRH